MRRGTKPAKAKVGAKRPVARKSPKTSRSKVRDLEQSLAEALDQQAATTEILRVISSSPSDVQPVFAAVLTSAARLCDAHDATIFQVEGDGLRIVAHEGPIPITPVGVLPLIRGTAAGRAVLDQRTIHVADLQAEVDEYPESSVFARSYGFRTVLNIPLLRGAQAIGTISIRRTEVRPFTDRQIELLETFADQVVLAIENVRLFTELRARNADLTEALEQQTAMAEILNVISRSPADLQMVLDAVARNASRLCGAANVSLYRVEGDLMRKVAEQGPPLTTLNVGETRPITRTTVSGRVIVDRTTIQLTDYRSAAAIREYPDVRRNTGIETTIGIPLLREGVAIGAFTAYRTEFRPFSEREIALLQTFADQAVIAIENVRLFQELQARNAELAESLEQQTATGEILRVIASSPTDLQPVMEAVAENAARVCGATESAIYALEGEHVRLVTRHGSQHRALAIGDTVPLSRDTIVGRVIGDRRTIHVEDIRTAEAEFPVTVSRTKQAGSPTRTIVATPLLREGTPLGVIFISRGPEVHPFTTKQIALLETFANQAVIAIENVRLFQELRERTAELTRSVEQLTALGDVGRALSSTLDLETVLRTIVTRANELAGTDGCAIYEFDEVAEVFRSRASRYTDAREAETLESIGRATPIPKGQGAVSRAAASGQPVQIPDIAVEGSYESPIREPLLRAGHRAILTVPLLLEQRVIGALGVSRKTPGEFAPEIVRLLTTFATQSALAMQNARLFREIADKSRQLEAASRHKSEFLANMSHELRTPLNAIIGFSEVLAERMFGDVNEKQAEYLQDILSSGRHLLSLINDILDLSKVEAGRLELELSRVHVPTALDHALTLVRERASRHGIALDVSLDAGVGDIEADERKVKQILLNLLSNAVKFTSDGGRVGVAATAGEGEGVITIAVSDTGIGIAPEDQDAIFEEFRQVGGDGARKREGTGLGLTLTKKFVELHGGRIWVESHVGRGSTFSFTLPVRPEGTSSRES